MTVPVDSETRTRVSSADFLRLNVGCGLDVRTGYINLDNTRNSSLDVIGSADRLPFRDACFETVFARDLLHHVRNPVVVLGELKRVTRSRIEIWESNRYNPYMFAYMLITGLTVHDHFSRRRFQSLFRLLPSQLSERNNFDHAEHLLHLLLPEWVARLSFRVVVALSEFIPSYLVAVVQCDDPSKSTTQE